jgi:hypothetical protein
VNTYVKASLINLRGQFRDPSLAATDAEGIAVLAATGVDPGRLFDPAGEIRFKVFPPGGPVETEVFGTDPDVQRDGMGLYRRQYKPTLEGDYAYRFESDVQIAAGEHWFKVQDTPF